MGLRQEHFLHPRLQANAVLRWEMTARRPPVLRRRQSEGVPAQHREHGRDSRELGSPCATAGRAVADGSVGELERRELLQGEEVNVTHELAQVRNVDDRRDNDDDETMEDVPGHGGAGPGATGGDIREEGEEAREGGSDGARA